ncbi:MAG: hypothetical protein ACQKBU_00475 [Verrucomicrobiales bacterium]
MSVLYWVIPAMKRHNDAKAMTTIKALHDQFQNQYREEEEPSPAP